eukprot:1160648-Pelagomonas_calceolata.AAC.4
MGVPYCDGAGPGAGDAADADADGSQGEPGSHAEAAPCQPEPAVCHAVAERRREGAEWSTEYLGFHAGTL